METTILGPRMSLSVVIATSCLAPDAERNISSGGKGRPHAERAWLLRNVILPCYTRWFPERFREIIVVGEYEEGEGYTYLPFPSVYRNCADALLKRQAGFDALIHKSVEWVLFQHDDHLWDPQNLIPNTGAYVLSPSRWTRARGEAEQLNDGMNLAYSPSDRYVNGHACLMKPHVFREGFKWTDAPPVFTWDISITARLQDLGIPIAYAPEVRTWDMERGAEPWR